MKTKLTKEELRNLEERGELFHSLLLDLFTEIHFIPVTGVEDIDLVNLYASIFATIKDDASLKKWSEENHKRVENMQRECELLVLKEIPKLIVEQ